MVFRDEPSLASSASFHLSVSERPSSAPAPAPTRFHVTKTHRPTHHFEHTHRPTHDFERTHRPTRDIEFTQRPTTATAQPTGPTQQPTTNFWAGEEGYPIPSALRLRKSLVLSLHPCVSAKCRNTRRNHRNEHGGGCDGAVPYCSVVAGQAASNRSSGDERASRETRDRPSRGAFHNFDVVVRVVSDRGNLSRRC